MPKEYRILVFGKTGCDKCRTLNKRLDTLLAKDEWRDFEKVYCDVETEEGLIPFCRSECINPNRIPAFLVMKKEDSRNIYRPVRNPHPGETDKICKESRLYTYLGLQTDYGEIGRGVITPRMLTSVLQEAQQL